MVTLKTLGVGNATLSYRMDSEDDDDWVTIYSGAVTDICIKKFVKQVDSLEFGQGHEIQFKFEIPNQVGEVKPDELSYDYTIMPDII